LVLVAKFLTIQPMRLLDFPRLEKAYSKKEVFSYFREDGHMVLARKAFLQGLHRLIAEPILPERHSDYLITQCLAEYLAHVRSRSVDGLIFRSTQRRDGLNVVLFPQPAHEPDLNIATPIFGLSFVEAKQLFETKAINYNTEERSFFRSDTGTIRIFYDDDEE
jgi:hypothetical protein